MKKKVSLFILIILIVFILPLNLVKVFAVNYQEVIERAEKTVNTWNNLINNKNVQEAEIRQNIKDFNEVIIDIEKLLSENNDEAKQKELQTLKDKILNAQSRSEVVNALNHLDKCKQSIDEIYSHASDSTQTLTNNEIGKLNSYLVILSTIKKENSNLNFITNKCDEMIINVNRQIQYSMLNKSSNGNQQDSNPGGYSPNITDGSLIYSGGELVLGWQEGQTILEVVIERITQGGKIALEDLKDTFYIVCIQHGVDIPARKHDERPNSDATVVLNGTIEELVEDVKPGQFIGTVITNSSENPYQSTERQSRTIASYQVGEEHNLLKAEAYVLAHSNTSPFSDGKYPNPVQVALWDLGIYEGGQMPNEQDKTLESETLKTEAEKLKESREQIYNLLKSNLEKILGRTISYSEADELLVDKENRIYLTDETNYDNCTVSYSADDSRQEYLVGPFKLNYVRSFLKTQAFSYVSQHDEKPDNIVDYSGITDFNMITNVGEIKLTKDNFVYTKNRITQQGDEAYQYPYPDEEFYIRLPYTSVQEATRITGLNIKVTDIDSEGKGYKLTGKYKDVVWEPKTEIVMCYDCDKNLDEQGVHQPHSTGNYKHWVEAVSVTEASKKSQNLKTIQNARIFKVTNELNIKLDLKLAIDLSGTVWLDNPSGKESEANGIKDSGEQGIKGVKVTIKPTNSSGKEQSVYTDENGYYEFKDIGLAIYDVEFEYDGQIYKTTKLLTLSNGEYGDVEAYINNPNSPEYDNNSKATEKQEERQQFNDKFYEITENTATSKNGTKSELTYHTENGVSTLITRDETTNIPLDLFKMQARTSSNGIYYPLHTNFHIQDYDKTINGIRYVAASSYLGHVNLGLVEREKADFALKKDVYNTDVTVNDKHTVYGYNTRTNIEAYDVEIRRETDYSNIYYNREIYKSDYNYRIDDYKDNDLNVSGSEIRGFKNIDQELKVFVTYKITVLNQSALGTGTINELVDYYDSTYKLINEDYYLDIMNENSQLESTLIARPSYYETSTGRTGNLTWGEKQDGKKFDGYNTIYTNGLKDLILASGEKVDIYITFEVLKDQNRSILLGEKNNVAEITNYSTFKRDATNKDLTEGLIDKDSNAGNSIPTDIHTFEDDTDSAPTINIKLHEDNTERRLNGLVWEDERNVTLQTGQIVGNGSLQKSEDKINGVRIQLVEKINVNGKEYEYIWKEMFTGETNYKYVDYNGNVSESNLQSIQKGEYLFSSYIPGNYIVRFIYGDTVKTILTTNNGGKNDISYNGQDYKSTAYQTGMNLEQEWYDLGSQNLNDESIRISDARDNELRRLNVIKYSQVITNNKGEILAVPYASPENNDLIEQLRSNTWMYSDTSKIRVEVEYNTTNTSGNEQHSYNIRNIDLGLEERPRTKIDVIKDILGVKITLANGNVLVDTVNGKDDFIKIVPSSSLNPRGQWYITLDSELTNNATIEVIYKITIANNSQIDTVANIPDSLEGITQTSNMGQYLGRTYYTGKDSNDNNIVKTKVDDTIDYLDNNFVFTIDNNNNWQVVQRQDLLSNGLINDTVSQILIDNNHRTLLQTQALNNILNPGETVSTNLILSKIMSSENSEDDLTYDNMAEIIRFTNTVGRRNAGDKADKGAIPGNQDPYSNEKEHDADYSPTITVGPSTGENRIYYIISATAAIILVVGIILIKKKVLKK